MKIVLASNNQGKINELNALISDADISIIGQSEAGVIGEAIEDGLTFVENAIKKARFAAEQTGLPALSDDSGLCIDALNGAPGLYSARFSLKDDEIKPNERSILDKANNEKALRLLEGEINRSAYFICVIVFIRHAKDPDPIICRGIWRGKIADELDGAGGFGYDPIFVGENQLMSAARLSKEEKNSISHRSQAIKALQLRINELSLK